MKFNRIAAFICGVLCGVLLFLIIGIAIGYQLFNDPGREFESGKFGDFIVGISTQKTKTKKDDRLTVHKQDSELFRFYKEDGELYIMDGGGGAVARAIFKNTKLIEISILSKYSRIEDKVVFSIVRNESEGSNDFMSFLVSGLMVDGEMHEELYMDLDYNGFLDVITITDSNSKILSSVVFFQDDWFEADHLSIAKTAAKITIDEMVYHLEFLNGKGWIETKKEGVEDGPTN